MMKNCVIPILAGCLFLTGCSGLKNIQDLTYIVSIGMDYDEKTKEYTAYLQGLNFANVAKLEGVKPSENIPPFIASATGETLNLAVSKLYKMSEPPLFFGHVNTLVLTKNIIKDHFKEVIEEVGRNRSLRHTLIVMTTEESLKDIFSINALFNYPSVYSILYKYNENDLYEDELKPITLMDFLRVYFEPMGVAKLPSVKIDSASWKEKKDYPVLYFDGFEVFQQQKYIDFIPFKDAILLNWLLEKNMVINRKVERDGKVVAAVKLSSPKMKVKYEKGTSFPKFTIDVSARVDVLEKMEDIPIKELQGLIEEEIRNKCKSIFNKGIEHKADVFNVGDKWYRKHSKNYKNIKTSKSFYLDNGSLKRMKVEVKVFHFNSYKYD